MTALRRPRTPPAVAWFDRWNVAAASSTGVAHLARSAENQDSFQTNLAVLKNPMRREANRHQALIVCVADGLGSNRHSAAGASLATAVGQTCAEITFFDQPWNLLGARDIERLLALTLRRVREEWRAAIVRGPLRALQHRPGGLRRRPVDAASGFHTTLIVAVLRPPWLAVAQVGDGFVVAQGGDGKCFLVGRPRPAHEYANTVSSLAAPAETVSLTVHCDRGIRGLAVSTDGLEDSLLSWPDATQPEPKEDFFTTMFAEVASGERDSERTLRMLRSPALRAQTDDDLTLVVASRSDLDGDRAGA